MSVYQFKRYLWLVDTLRHEDLSYKEICEKWQYSAINENRDKKLPLRTFHNHREAIESIFKIKIEIGPGYKYHICKLENDRLLNWLVDSYAVLNQIQADSKLLDRVEFEDIPSGHTWLTTFMHAMRENKVMEVTHKGFRKDYANTFQIEPYCLKVVRRRWYIIANNPYYEEQNKKHMGEKGYSPHKEIRVYGLDRITEASLLDKTFEVKKDFSMDEYFDGCTGVIPSDDPVEHVVLKAYVPDYLRTFPLHESQMEITNDEESATFSYDVKLTYDFIQLIMQQGDQVEVLEPQKLRNHIRNLVKTLTFYYKN